MPFDPGLVCVSVCVYRLAGTCATSAQDVYTGLWTKPQSVCVCAEWASSEQMQRLWLRPRTPERATKRPLPPWFKPRPLLYLQRLFVTSSHLNNNPANPPPPSSTDVFCSQDFITWLKTRGGLGYEVCPFFSFFILYPDLSFSISVWSPCVFSTFVFPLFTVIGLKLLFFFFLP